MNTKLKYTKTIGYQVPLEYKQLEAIVLKEVRNLTYKEQWVIAKYLCKYMVYRLFSENEIKGKCAVLGIRYYDVIRTIGTIAEYGTLQSKLSLTKQELSKHILSPNHLQLSQLESAMFTIVANNFFKENKGASLLGMCSAMGITNVTLQNNIKVWNPIALHTSEKKNRTKKLEKTILLTNESKISQLEASVKSIQKAQKSLMNALLGLSEGNPTAYKKIQGYLKESIIEGGTDE